MRLVKTRHKKLIEKNQAKGFTLVEVMIAMAILALAIVTVFQSQSQSISMETRSRFITTASLLAQSRMAEIEMTGIENLTVNQGDFGEQFPDYTWICEVKDTEIDIIKKVELIVKNNKLALNNEFRLVLYSVTSKEGK